MKYCGWLTLSAVLGAVVFGGSLDGSLQAEERTDPAGQQKVASNDPTATNSTLAEGLQSHTVMRPEEKENVFKVKPGEHPLALPIRWAKAGLERLKQIEDYECRLVKRERIDGVLHEHKFMELKLRHEPFSVYIRELAPKSGREVIYVNGQFNNRILGHTTGSEHRLIGTVSISPTGPRAMSENRYPITEVGIFNLTKRLIEEAEKDLKWGEIDVKYYGDAKLNGRSCTCMEFIHPNPRKEFRYHIARVYIDNEKVLPVRYSSYTWPRKPGEDPPLIEEYTYLDVKVNVGLTDKDFDVNNPKYGYRRPGEGQIRIPDLSTSSDEVESLSSR